MHDFTVVEPGPLDLASLEEISRIDREAFGEDGLTANQLSLLAQAGWLFALREGDAFTAEAVVLRKPDPSGALLFGLAVGSPFRGKGRGRFLMERVREELRARGILTLELTVSPANAPAVHLYIDRLGFRVCRLEPGRFGPGNDRLVLAADLGPSGKE